MQFMKQAIYGLGLGISTFDQIENREDQKNLLTKMFGQMLIIEQGLALGDLLHQNITGIPLTGRVSPWFLRGIAWAPMICYFLSNYTNHSGGVGKTVTLIQNHLNTVGVIAISVAAVSLIAFGHHLMGISFLASSAYEMLCQYEIVPVSIKSGSLLVEKVLSVSFSILFCSWPMKIMTMITVSSLVLQKFFKIEFINIFGKLIAGRHFNRNVEKTPLTKEIINIILTNTESNNLVEINFRHLDKKNFSMDDLPQEIFSILQSYRRTLCEKIFEAFLATSMFFRSCQFSQGKDFTVLTKNPFMKFLQEPFAYTFDDEAILVGSSMVAGAVFGARDELVKYFHEGGTVKGLKLARKEEDNNFFTSYDLISCNFDENSIEYTLQGYNVNNILNCIHGKFFKESSTDIENPLITYFFKEVLTEKPTYISNMGTKTETENPLLKYLLAEVFVTSKTQTGEDSNSVLVEKEESFKNLEKPKKEIIKTEKKIITLLLIHLGVFNFKTYAERD